MKSIEKLIIVASILAILSMIAQHGSNHIISWWVNTTGMDTMNAIQVKAALDGVFRLLVPGVIAIWLFGLARRDGASPWIWALLALAYQFLAPVLYFALKIYRSVETHPLPEKKIL